MASPFRSQDAKRLIEEHQRLLKKLAETEPLSEELRTDISKAVDGVVAPQVLKLLQDIPVEEINREKQGFRVKALREYGYQSIGDMATASVYSLASVQGISEDSARAIKRIVDELVYKAKRSVKVKLNSDNRTDTSSKLIVALSKYIHARQSLENCRQLVQNNQYRVEHLIQDLKPGFGALSWIFASRADKGAAENAYSTLKEYLDSGYGKTAYEMLDTIDQALRVTVTEAWAGFSANPIAYNNALEDICPGVFGNDDAVYGLPEELAKEIQDQCFFPDGLLCELRPYQEWGVKYILHQEQVLLGDEMGLGKTIQAIATMVSLRNTGATHFVVVCPASVIENWCREICKMSRLTTTKIHGAGRAAALKAWVESGGVAVTTYETTAYFKLDDDFLFTLLVVDEAHYIKNPEARRSINVRNIASHAERQLFMTGTALENKVDEMIALIRLLQPNIAAQVKGIAFLSSAPQFREKIAPVYYRRKREDVLTELPDMIESKEWCALFPEEEKIYESAVMAKHYSDTRRVSWSVDDPLHSSKAIRMKEIVEEAKEDGRKVIVFSFFIDTMNKVVELLGDACTSPINGSVSPARRQEIIDEFNSAPCGTVLPAQIQAGGTGLNIQAASVVILCEPQLKPSIENQAVSRAYRMGQSRNVLVYRLLCQNTIDEKIMALLENKQEIFDAFADQSAAAQAQQDLEIDSRKFGDLINEEIERIKAKNAKAGAKTVA